MCDVGVGGAEQKMVPLMAPLVMVLVLVVLMLLVVQVLMVLVEEYRLWWPHSALGTGRVVA